MTLMECRGGQSSERSKTPNSDFIFKVRVHILLTRTSYVCQVHRHKSIWKCCGGQPASARHFTWWIIFKFRLFSSHFPYMCHTDVAWIRPKHITADANGHGECIKKKTRRPSTRATWRAQTKRDNRDKLNKFDWCCFYYFVRNSLIALLKAICAQKDKWEGKDKIVQIWLFRFW